MFVKILIANRGEIACRIARTCRKLGVKTVAIYSEADRGALHVREASEAVSLGMDAPGSAYLSVEKILGAAQLTGAEAIHPGYGFLSEKAELAQACVAAGLEWIGPPVPALEAMGKKSRARQIMIEAGVPVVPGYHGADQTPGRLRAEAEKLGYPLLVKACAGGGGKGMRRVPSREDWEPALQAARREAKKAFADDRVLLERLIPRPRHVEIQVFGDKHGQVVHLFERDCSIQRRHQKIIEEAPAPSLTRELREGMGEAAVEAARAIDYCGAGTVEFVLDPDGRFFFIEMNTRLQVEHPVTEMITGIDLVEWQLRIAAGDRIPLAQDEIQARGHSLEARIYAEDPESSFLPSTGVLRHLRWPQTSSTLRVETGLLEGDSIGLDYDPMIAKIVVWGKDRDQALTRMATALGQTEIAGPRTNLQLLRTIFAEPSFQAAKVHTGFIEEGGMLAPCSPPSPDLLSGIGAAFVELRKRERSGGASPWAALDSWKLNLPEPEPLVLSWRDQKYHASVEGERGAYRVAIEGREQRVRLTGDGSEVFLEVSGRRMEGRLLIADSQATFLSPYGRWEIEKIDPLGGVEGGAVAEGGSLTAPMPGRIIKILVESGVRVRRGQDLLILEAMKMEHTVSAPTDGTVSSVRFSVGDLAQEGDVLVCFEAATED